MDHQSLGSKRDDSETCRDTVIPGYVLPCHKDYSLLKQNFAFHKRILFVQSVGIIENWHLFMKCSMSKWT